MYNANLIDKAFKGTVVNLTLPSLHGGSLEITLTVPSYTGGGEGGIPLPLEKNVEDDLFLYIWTYPPPVISVDFSMHCMNDFVLI